MFYDIFDYWKDKAITKDGEIVIETGYEGCDEEKFDIANTIPVVIDWGEPQCFACGSMIYGFGDIRDDIELKTLWNLNKPFSHMQRCHIVPKALGGSDSPSNLFMLCKECHHDSPDTIYPKAFFRWVYQRRTHSIMDEVREQLDSLGIPYNFVGAVDINNFSKIGNSHGGNIVRSTLVSLYVGGAEEAYKKYQTFISQMNDYEKYIELNDEEKIRLGNLVLNKLVAGKVDLLEMVSEVKSNGFNHPVSKQNDIGD